MAVNISDAKFKTLIKESVKEAIRAEIMKLRALALPYVSEKEQRDIEKRYGAPSKKTSKSHALKV